MKFIVSGRRSDSENEVVIVGEFENVSRWRQTQAQSKERFAAGETLRHQTNTHFSIPHRQKSDRLKFHFPDYRYLKV